MSRFPLNESEKLPKWQRPESLLMLMALAMPLAFSVWMAMLNNFSHDVAAFQGDDIGAIQAIREIPGFLAILVVYLLLLFTEQRLALISLLLLGLGTAMTGFLPSFWGIALTTMISSIGFHYYETVNQSLQLQWVPKERAPQVLGRLAGIGSSTAFIAFGLVWLLSQEGVVGSEPPYALIYVLGGVATMLLALIGWLAWPHFAEGTAQTKKLVFKKRYWLYYAIVGNAGARRQIFVVFAAFMVVDRFGFALHDMALLLIVNHAVSVFFLPMMGRMVGVHGERAVLTFEYIGLIAVFSAYGLILHPQAGAALGSWAYLLPMMAAALYVIDHIFFGLHFAQRTYFQKIADPEDFAPTAAVAFTINHIAAVALPYPLGLLYLYSPGAVFWIGVALAFLSLGLSRLIPRHPEKGHETTLSAPAGLAAAE
ncbi:MAG: MFS transporter [Neomegalonema sp.]|nr:MFS transporter [Neomegalonema sp.]